MALTLAPRIALGHHQRMRPGYRMAMGLNLLRLPLKDLHEELKKQIDTNPALADCKFDLPPGWAPESAASLSGDNSFLFENRAAEESLYEHLSRELAISGAEGALRDKALEIIGDLDENGRYTGGELDGEGERARALVMTLDPVGCGARTLSECYMAQLDRIPKADRELAAKVIGEIDSILAGKAKLTPDLQVTAARVLACLDPKPGLKYSSARPDYIVPDIIVDKNGNMSVERGNIPEIRISSAYANLAADRSQDPEVREYAKAMVKHVKDLQFSVANRFSTLERLAGIIVERQIEYIMKRGEMKPLKMKEVAEAAHCHRSTVSRAAERKYLRGPCGLVRLKDFFSVSDDSCRRRFAEIMQNPDLRKLSDARVAKLLNSEGFKIARRTVNKYRSEMKP